MKNDIYKKFGECWNEADFSSLSNKLIKECTYTSFDYFYKLKGSKRLIEFLDNQAKLSLDADEKDKTVIYKGYYQKTDTVVKSIKECCLLIRQSDMKPIRILTFSKRFGKISSIQGLDPDKVKSIRDQKV